MNSTLYAVCGNCGHKIGKYGSGSLHEAPCPKCGANLLIETQDREVKVTVIDTRQERKAETQAG